MRLRVTTEDVAANMRVIADLKLPYGVGTVVAEPINPSQPMAQLSFSGPVTYFVFSARRSPTCRCPVAALMPFGVFALWIRHLIPVLLLTQANGRVFLG